MKRKKTFLLLGVLAVILASAYLYLNRTTNVNSTDIQGYIPIKNDALAARYAPKFAADKQNEIPYKLYYRAANDGEGNTYISYHPVWPNEVNRNKGLMPFLNRALYTEGLRLQSIMFGKEDIEAVLLKTDKNGKITEIQYETADKYDPKSFGVSHKAITLNDGFDTPGYFKVISWNHLFEYTNVLQNNNGSYRIAELTPEYFTDKEWNAYGMFKERETFLSRNRAHFIFERKSAES